MTNGLMRLDGVAERLACSVATVRRLIADGKLHGCKVRGGRRVFQESLEAYVREIRRQEIENEQNFLI